MSENNIQNEQELWDVLDGNVPTVPKTEAKATKSKAKFAKGDSTKVDSFFLTCMAGVAAVSVAVTMLITSLTGGSSAPVRRDPAPAGTEAAVIEALEQENAELREQLELQKKQIKDLQSDLLEAIGEEEYLATVPSGSGEEASQELEEQQQAYALFTQIQDAYAEQDWEKLDEMIPQMDQYVRNGSLSKDALNSYYLILEYMEQQRNG